MEKKTSYFNYAGLLEFMYLDHQNTDLYLSHCGMQQCNPNHSYGNIARPEYHLHVILDGEGYYQIHDKKYALKRGQLFIIPPDVSDYMYQADNAHPWYYAWVAVNGAKAGYYMKQAGFDPTHVVRDANLPPEEYTGLIYEMLKSSQLTFANELDRAGYLFLLMSLLIESNGLIQVRNHYQNSNDTYIAQALQYIQFNYNRNIQVNDIACYVGINRSYFSSLFKQKMDISPKKYLQKFRIEKAKVMLAESTEPVSEIARKAGLKDPFVFSKLFKQIEGISPRAYRNQVFSREL